MKQIYQLVGEEYTILDKYINSKTKILIKHNKCGNEYKTIPSNFLKGRRCPRCAKIKVANKLKKTHEEFLFEIQKIFNNKYIILEPYINSSKKIKTFCTECKTIWYPKASHLLEGHECPKCKAKIVGKKLTKSHDKFVQEVYNLVKDEYDILDKYQNGKTKIKFKHNICNYEFYMTPFSFLQGSRCPKCNGGVRKKDTDYFKKEVYDLVGDEYSVLSDYKKTAYDKVLMKHNICNYEYWVTPHNFLRGKRCPICNQSKGEQKIQHWLKENNISFKPQYTFNDLKDIKLLKFDFAIFKNNKLIYLIEYDGIFHFKKQYDQDGFETLKYHDEIKNIYCKQNNIPLLRIPYWEFDNIEQILINWQKKF